MSSRFSSRNGIEVLESSQSLKLISDVHFSGQISECYFLTCLYLLNSVRHMKITLIRFLTILLFSTTLSYPSIAQAVVVRGLYEAEVPVSDQSASNRKKNMAAVLRVVLIKLTGDRQVPSRNGVTELLLNADQYVQQFEYRTKEEDKQQLTLWARFNSASLDKILREAAIPEWGRERPSTLVWLAVSDAIGRRLTGLSDISGYVEKMESRAKNRGILLVHPLLDLEDTNQLQLLMLE